MYKKTILITGALGFIGHHLSLYFAKKKFNLILIDNFGRKLKKKDLKKRIKDLENLRNVKIINSDITKIKNLNNIKLRINTIIHLAAINGTKNFYKIPDKVLDVLINGGYNILKFAHAKKVENLYFFSSSEVYQKPKNIPTKEDVECIVPNIWNPRYSYGGGKLAQELMISNLFPNSFKRRVIIRPHNIYGTNMGTDHVIPEIIDKIRKAKKKGKKHIEIVGSKKNTRSFMHINDFLNAFYILFKKSKNREIYNIGNNDEISIEKLIKKITKKLKYKTDIIENLKMGKGQTNRRCPNINKITKLGYKQKITIDKGIGEMIENKL